MTSKLSSMCIQGRACIRIPIEMQSLDMFAQRFPSFIYFRGLATSCFEKWFLLTDFILYKIAYTVGFC